MDAEDVILGTQRPELAWFMLNGLSFCLSYSMNLILALMKQTAIAWVTSMTNAWGRSFLYLK